jgi:hypothetical protein
VKNEVLGKMATYNLKSQSMLVDLDERVYAETSDLYYLLTGKGREEARDAIPRPSPEVAIQVLNALDLGSQLVATNDMIGYTPIGQDVIWLGIARAKLTWKKEHNDNSISPGEYDLGLKSLDMILDELSPLAVEEYNRNRMPYARGRPVDLGITIKR